MRKSPAFAIAFALVLVFGLATAAGAAVNPNCTQTGNRFDCPILTGVRSYQAVFDINKPYLVENIQIHNNTPNGYQLQWVTAGTSDPYWGEFSVYLDLFQTLQINPGIGEVVSRDWDPFVKSLPMVTWDAQFDGQGLAIPPGSTVFLHNNADAMVANGVQYSVVSYGVQVAQLTNGVRSFRQPRVDAPIACNGQVQSTVWNPWKNTSGINWKVDGATIYAVVPFAHATTVACIYILNTSNQVRWQTCTNVNKRGMVGFPQQLVHPGESLAAQAIHTCSAPGVWDWAAFLHVY